jgi:recombination protein RecA
VIISGDPKTGKTTTALYFAAKAQKLGKNVFYFNTEGRLTKENFKGIKDLDTDNIKIVQATDKEPMVSAEKYLNTLETYIKNTPDLVAIIDSTSSMVPQDELDGEIRTGVRNALPRLLSMFFKRISGDVARMKAICIFITHNIANTGGSRYSPNKMADCGNMLQYQAGTNMVITHRGKWEVPKDSGNHVGQVANWVIKTSAAGGIPNSTAEGWIRYGVGIDECQEVAQIASEFAMINRSGAWYTISCAVENKDDPVIKSWLIENEIDPENDEAISKAFKFQGMEKVNTFLEENTEITQFIYEQIREVFL